MPFCRSTIQKELTTIAALKSEVMALEEERSDQETATVFMEPPRKHSAFSRILNDDIEPAVSSQSTSVERVEHEIDVYLQMPVFDTDQSPLEWWKKEESQFPILSKLARKYLCICATSVASERVFSTAGYIGSNLRSCLKPEKIDKLTFLARNLD